MRARRRSNTDLGEAISMEDAISMMTIIFVLFVIFLVPLVSIDKARLEAKRQDSFWADVVTYLEPRSSTQITPTLSQYRDAFGLSSSAHFVNYSRINQNGIDFSYVEFLDRDSSLVVARHNLKNNRFTKMTMTVNGETTTYQHGEIGRIRGSKEWFIIDQLPQPDYAGRLDSSKQFNEQYRAWRNSSMKGQN